MKWLYKLFTSILCFNKELLLTLKKPFSSHKNLVAMAQVLYVGHTGGVALDHFQTTCTHKLLPTALLRISLLSPADL